MTMTYRDVKGSPLTSAEVDGNFRDVVAKNVATDSKAQTAQNTANNALTAAGAADTKASNAQTAANNAQTTANGKQDSNAKLSAIAASVWAANSVMVLTGASSLSVLTYAAFKAALGLDQVNNTTDANKPVSTATQTALNAKQNLHANLTGLSALTPVSNSIPMWSGASGAMVNQATGTAGRAVLAASTADTILASIGLTRPFLNTVSETGDFNNILSDGWHPSMCNQAMTNSPASLWTGQSGLGNVPTYWYVHNTIYQNVNNIIQVAYPHDNVGFICWRLKVGANWAGWNRCLSNNEKTSSSTDTTAGRLLKVGDYGWGASPAADSSLSGLGYTTTFRSFNDASSPNLNAFVGINLQREVGGRGMAIAITDNANKLFWGTRATPASAFTWKEAVAVGDYGIGATNSVPLASDMNVVATGGLRRFSPSTTNMPSGAQYGGVLELMHEKSSENWAQLMVSMVSPRAWIRSRINAAAPTSAELYSTANLFGTVSQTGGVPTGAVFENGSNANGTYVRFADGTQICRGVVTSASAAVNANAAPAITYPAPFLAGSVPALSGLVQPSGNWDHYGMIGSTAMSSAGANVYVRNGATGAQTFNIVWTAVGRWF